MVRIRQHVARVIYRRNPALAHAISPSAAYAMFGAERAEAFVRGVTGDGPADPAAFAAALDFASVVAHRSFFTLYDDEVPE